MKIHKKQCAVSGHARIFSTPARSHESAVCTHTYLFSGAVRAGLIRSVISAHTGYVKTITYASLGNLLSAHYHPRVHDRASGCVTPAGVIDRPLTNPAGVIDQPLTKPAGVGYPQRHAARSESQHNWEDQTTQPSQRPRRLS